jgi:hypothetical protein
VTEQSPRRLRLDKNKPGPLIPSALETYRALRADDGEPGKRIKQVLEQLRDNPGQVRAKSLRYRPNAWIALVRMPDESTWWVIWREAETDAIDILWIGPQPGPDALAYTSETLRD